MIENWKNTEHLGDCLEIMKGIPDKSIDFIFTDLPYGTTACDWDILIPFDLLWAEYYRIIRPNGFIALFGSQPFTSLMIQSNIKNYSHSWVWNKKKGGNILLSKVNPMKIHEDIILFSNEFAKHDNTGKNPIRDYLIQEKGKSGLTNKEFNNLFSDYTNKKGNRDRSVLEHYWGKAQFTFPTKDIYQNVLQPTGFFKKPYSDIEEIGKKYRLNNNKELNDKYPRVYNPQMTKRDKIKRSKNYGIGKAMGVQDNSNGKIFEYTEKYPTSIIEVSNANQKGKINPTQKPVALIEYLIKTYSNENEIVLDSTAGSFTLAEACINTNRNYIVIEKDTNEFKKGSERIKKHKQKLAERLF